MELKEARLGQGLGKAGKPTNPFNGIERRVHVDVEESGVLVLNPFNGIERRRKSCRWVQEHTRIQESI